MTTLLDLKREEPLVLQLTIWSLALTHACCIHEKPPRFRLSAGFPPPLLFAPEFCIWKSVEIAWSSEDPGKVT